MKHLSLRQALLLAITTFLYSTTMGTTRVAPYFSIRSQGVNMPRHTVGTDFDTYEREYSAYGILNVTPSYMQSFNSNHITRCLFGDSLNGNNQLTVSGSTTANRGTKDLLADYFYLPSDFKSIVCFNPVIDNFIIDFNLYISLDQWVPNTYCAIYTPLVHSRWFLDIHESVKNYGVQPYPAGIFTPAILNRGTLLEDFKSFVCGTEVNPIPNDFAITATTSSSFLPLTIMQQLKNGKISCKRKDATRMADLRAYIGWNIKRENYHVGLIIETAIPTGTRPQGEFLFEPIIGNGNNWELGAGIEWHYNLWNNESETALVKLYARADITTLFNTRQMRTFDLCGKPLSRYMLTQKMNVTQNNLQGAGTTPIAQFQQEFAPVANISTIPVKVSVGAQAEILCMVHADFHQWSMDIGYNIWAQSREKIKALGINVLDKNSTWALKGDARMFGFASIDDPMAPALTAGQAVALSATQNKATVYSGLNGTNTINSYIDTPEPAFAGGTPTTLNNSALGGMQINTSIQPIFIKETDLNISGASTNGLSSTLFTHINYTGTMRKQWVPHVGLGGQIEIGHTHNTCSTDSNSVRCSLSQWGIWVKTGFSFE